MNLILSKWLLKFKDLDFDSEIKSMALIGILNIEFQF
jgi:hypothetical protein